jgi:hypothetical protein
MTTMTTPGSPTTAPKRRRSRTVRRLVIAFAVLIGLLVVADFAAAAIFEHQVSKRAKAHFGLNDDPEVRVGGFSFLLQAISGEYDQISVDAKGVPVKDTLRDVQLHADLKHVNAPLGDLLSGNSKGIKAQEVEGEIKVNASDINRAIGRAENEVVRSFTRLTIDPVTEKVATTAPEENAEEEPPAQEEPEDTTAGVRMCGTAEVIDQSTEFCVFGIISLVDSKITFSPKRLEIRNALTSGSLSPQLQRRMLEPFAFTLDPGGLPFTVTPTAVKVTQGTVAMKGKARDAVLTGGS